MTQQALLTPRSTLTNADSSVGNGMLKMKRQFNPQKTLRQLTQDRLSLRLLLIVAAILSQCL